jgi:hypothetical protein
MQTIEGTNYSLTALVREGYYFCRRCERIVQPVHNVETLCDCPRCGHKTAEWQHPIDFYSNN